MISVSVVLMSKVILDLVLLGVSHTIFKLILRFIVLRVGSNDGCSNDP